MLVFILKPGSSENYLPSRDTSKSFHGASRTAGFYPYLFLTSYPSLPLGKKGALISSGAGPRVGEWDLGPGPELARGGGKCFTESSRELHGKGVNTSAVNPVMFLDLV